MDKHQTIHYIDGYITTPDDFDAQPSTHWGVVFSEPVKVESLVRAICDAGLPVIEFGTIDKKEPVNA